MNRPIRVLAVMEAVTVTGPARNLLEFAVRARSPERDGRSAELEVLTFVRGGSSENAFLTALQERGIPVHLVFEAFPFDPRVLARMAAIIAKLQPDIVQTHGVKSHFLFALLRLKSVRTPWIAFHHGYTAEDAKMRLYNNLNRWSLPRADHVLTVCTPFRKLLEATGVRDERIDVLANTIDPRPPVPPDRSAALRNALGLSSSTCVLLAVGRLSPEKGHMDLLNAMQQIVTHVPGRDLRLVLVGDGLLGEKLTVAAKSLRIESSVIFAGHQKNTADYYGIADIFVLPSHSEGSPNVLLEAMAAGLAIVSTDVGGVPDTAEHEKSALLVPAHNPAAMAAAVEQLIGNPDQRATLGRNASERIAQFFRPAHYRDALLNIYTRLLEKTQ